ncbi:unnamed protein product [Dovyalis caffra]|uniref:NTF2 domain-containing protein n=1 Tax=Dovyalis caffra TaxID=77055 RepID=A0AAV1QW84_9ROSI|nr:unnamed protein product [Dovyalis caffra]
MQETAPAYAPSAEDVANAFVEQYYDALHKSPGVLHQFYQDSSLLTVADKNGGYKTVTAWQVDGLFSLFFVLEQAINENYSFDYDNLRAETETVNAQESYGQGVIILVTGTITNKDENVTQKFTQTFFLAPGDEGYFVLNDIFRAVGEIEPTPNTSALADGIGENAPPTALTAESSWDEVGEPEPAQATNNLPVHPVTQPPSRFLPFNRPLNLSSEVSITGATITPPYISSDPPPRHPSREGQMMIRPFTSVLPPVTHPPSRSLPFNHSLNLSSEASIIGATITPPYIHTDPPPTPRNPSREGQLMMRPFTSVLPPIPQRPSGSLPFKRPLNLSSEVSITGATITPPYIHTDPPPTPRDPSREGQLMMRPFTSVLPPIPQPPSGSLPFKRPLNLSSEVSITGATITPPYIHTDPPPPHQEKDK